MTKYGLIGYPLGHSFSASFFNEKFCREQLNAVYENYEISTIEDFQQVITDNPTLKGLNVTIPYKQQIIPFLHALSTEAQAIGAVNVIQFMRQDNNLRIVGHNTDVIGFRKSIEPLLSSSHKRALILGTGGASKAVNYALRSIGIKTSFVSRTEGKSDFTYQQITPALLHEYTVIVNCSPLGMFPHIDGCPPLPYEAMSKDHLLYDLVYNPEETLFLKKGRKQGTITKNGLEMLHLQAIAAWSIWQNEES